MAKRKINDPAALEVLGAIVDIATADKFREKTGGNTSGAIEAFIKAINEGTLHIEKIEEAEHG